MAGNNSDGKDMECSMDIAETEIKIVEYAEARAKEIEAMDLASRKVTGNSKASQMLPNHMRRRAASHNIKRLPRRLRNKAIKEMKAAPPKKSKRPSRKHRRRPSNLLQDYNRRKRRIMWLETHIWHAKRFHMEELWGYKIPNFPNDKSLRACYRASNQHCLMWDMSYLNCVEITGMEEHILQGIEALSSSTTGLSFGSKATTSGCREGTTFLFAANQYPKGAIGPVSYMWKPKAMFNGTENNKRTLWLWTHPSVYNNVLTELAAVFKANQVAESKKQIKSQMTGIKANEMIEEKSESSSNGKVFECNSGKQNSRRNCDKLHVKHPDIDMPTYRGPDVEFSSLKDTLCRFRLLGPLSQALLADLLNIACVMKDTDVSDKTYGDDKWWENFYNCEKAVNLHESQGFVWMDMKNALYPAYMPPGTILGLTVRDPRITLPNKRIKVTADTHKETAQASDFTDRPTQCSQWPEISYSPIWESNVRSNVKETMLTQQQINDKRSETFLPGTEVDLGRDESRIPILLVHKPGNLAECVPTVISGPNNIKQSIETFGSGWDIIVPGGWGMAFWVGLVYRGARVGGLRELSNTQFEAGWLNFPNYSPDSLAGKQMENSVKEMLQDKYNKKPPAKRPSYDKLGVKEPFHCPWKKLVKTAKEVDGDIIKKDTGSEIELQNSDCPFFVLRDQQQVQKLCPESVITFVELKQNFFFASVDKKFSKEKIVGCDSNGSMCNNYKLTAEIQPSPNSVVAVQLKLVQRGTCEAFSHICCLTEVDCNQLKVDINYRGPIEPLHVVCKTGLIATKEKSVLEADKKSKEMSTKLSRKVIGYISVGGFSLKLGQGAGLGYVSQMSLLKIMEEQGTLTPLVLVRAPATFQYSFAVLSMITKDKLCNL